MSIRCHSPIESAGPEITAVYRRLGGRYTRLDGFTGFPLDGLWLAKNGSWTLLISSDEMATPEMASQLNELVHYLSSIDDLTRALGKAGSFASESLAKAACNFFDTYSPTIEAENRPPRPLPVEEVFYRTGRRYTHLGFTFSGFPHNGIWHVEDGKHNKLSLFMEIPVFRASIRHRAHQAALAKHFESWQKGTMFSLFDVSREVCFYFVRLANSVENRNEASHPEHLKIETIPQLKGRRLFVKYGDKVWSDRGFRSKKEAGEWIDSHWRVMDWRAEFVFRLRGDATDIEIVDRKGRRAK